MRIKHIKGILNELQLYIYAFLFLIFMAISAHIFQSHMEAKAYNRITGQHVSTWDAMWVELRVQSGPGDAYGMKLEAIHEAMDKDGSK